jgi:5-methylcytosine-specific restriction endonuclease McrA
MQKPCHDGSMEEKQSKRYHKWTVHDQVTAEVAAACGCSLSQLKKLFKTSHMQVLRRLKPQKAEKHREANARWKKCNQKKSLEISREWKANNKERRKEVDKQWRQNNPEAQRERGRRRRARKYDAINKSSLKVTAKDIETLKNNFGQSCAYCGAVAKITIDHVVPLAKGGTHEIENLLPCCQSCNSSKNCTPLKSWYQSKDFFSQDRWDAIVKYHSWLEQA